MPQACCGYSPGVCCCTPCCHSEAGDSPTDRLHAWLCVCITQRTAAAAVPLLLVLLLVLLAGALCRPSIRICVLKVAVLFTLWCLPAQLLLPGH